MSSTSTAQDEEEAAAEFNRAVTYIASSTTSVPSATKLRLYALYKISTVSVLPPGPRPGLWDFTARAKWDAWSQLGSQGEFQGEQGREKARGCYLDLVRELGMPLKGEGEQQEEGTRRTEQPKEAMVKVSTLALPPSSSSDQDQDIPPSPLHDLCIKGDLPALVLYLSSSSSSSREGEGEINSLDGYGFSPLGLAVDRGHPEIVRLLLDRGADPSLVDQDGNTPLQLAEMVQDKEMIEVLSRGKDRR